ncbi:A24 family peptidase [Aurantiacibacter hainanensis]|uniref:A24 family peptidase n=1 Tax=Aurantiacibacter hainanensis TaxID=3076114 RepID=UPI0030C74A63
MPDVLPLVALGAMSLVAAGYDLATRRIPNWLNLAILFAGAAMLFALPTWSAALMHLAHFAIALIAAMALFGMRVWGGGDAKFYAAVAIWLPLSEAHLLALGTALSGAVLVVLIFAWAMIRQTKGWAKNLPYGVAIAAGTFAAVLIGKGGSLLV